MGYRIMRLLQRYKSEDEFNTEIEDGIMFTPPDKRISLGYNGYISSMYTPSQDFLFIKTIHDYIVEELEDGNKELKIYPNISDSKEAESEDGILLYSEDFENMENLTQILGQYLNEGMVLLKPHDKILIKNGEVVEKFVALQYDKKMYLIKIHED